MNILRHRVLTIGQRVSVGFAFLLLLGVLLGSFAAWRMSRAATGASFLSQAVAPQADVSSRLAQASLEAQREVRSYSLTGDAASLKETRRHLADIETALADAETLSAAQPALTALQASLGDAKIAVASFKTELAATIANLDALATIRENLDQSAATFVQQVGNLITDQETKLRNEIATESSAEKLESRREKLKHANGILNDLNAVRIATFKTQATRDDTIVRSALPLFDDMEVLRQNLVAVAVDPLNLKQLARIGDAAQSYRAGIDAVIANSAEARAVKERRVAASNRFNEVATGLQERSVQRTLSFAEETSGGLKTALQFVLIGLLVMVVGGIGGAVLILRGITAAISRTAETLTQGSLQVASASGQVSAASQSLAEGSSEQAASLEEISSSIEELSSMTKRNADNASNGNVSAAEARRAAEAGAGEMEQMQQAMNAIQESSTDISRIIKTIDEIAFQTNILALNAAVEAARAGEAGAGFAVVADEVRSLAQRSAVAARETADKIADATSRSAQGVEISGRVAAGLEQIVVKAREVDRLVAEVAVASKEQSEGLSQINSAITQMDKVTQSSAASAEETASAAEELNAQSEELRTAANDLAALAGIRRTDASGPTERGPTSRRAASSRSTPLASGPPAAVIEKPMSFSPAPKTAAVEEPSLSFRD